LKLDGFLPWLDEEDLIPGQGWQDEIPVAVRTSDVVVVCVSRSSVNKEGYVQKEIKFALDVSQEKPEGAIFVIPVRIEEVEVPRSLRQWQWVNWFDKDGYQRLLRALHTRATALGLAVPAPAPQNHTGRNEPKQKLQRGMMNQSMERDSSSVTPLGILREATNAAPAVKFALGLAGVLAAVAIVTAVFRLSLVVAALGAAMMFVLMTGLVIFARVASASSKTFVRHVDVFSWFSLILIMATATLLFTSVSWDYPVDLKQFVNAKNDGIKHPMNATLPDQNTTRNHPGGLLSPTIAGIVVNQETNQGIGHAAISIAGRVEEYLTEDTGNFRINLPADAPKRVRLRVSKSGFQPLDTSIEQGAENTILQLHK
jgi:hypothetical protein